MQQTLVWKPWTNPGIENLRLHVDAAGIHASSHLMLSAGGQSFAATYVLDYDPCWRFRSLWIKVDNHGQSSLRLQRDIPGQWRLDGQPRGDLDACQQVLLSASPFAHTPILQRSALECGQSEELQVAFIDLPSLAVQARGQRYQCLRQQGEQTLYRCEPQGRHSSELALDRNGLVLKATDQFLRLAARTLTLDELPISTLV